VSTALWWLSYGLDDRGIAYIYIPIPLTKLTEEKQAFQWTPEVEDAFQTLREAFCTAPILSYPQPGERFVIDTDANFGIRGVVSQVQDGRERAVLKREQREWLENNHRENRTRGKEGETDHRRHKHSPRKEEMAVRL
jgi:hypothetical protein